MKTLCIFNDKGECISTLLNVEDGKYTCIVEDIPPDKRPIRLDKRTNKIILGDSFEIDEQKKKEKEQLEEEQNQALDALENLNEELESKKNKQLDIMFYLVETEYQKLLLN